MTENNNFFGTPGNVKIGRLMFFLLSELSKKVDMELYEITVSIRLDNSFAVFKEDSSNIVTILNVDKNGVGINSYKYENYYDPDSWILTDPSEVNVALNNIFLG